MKVRELLSSAEKWTQGVYARRQDGSETYPTYPDAASWCIAGAIVRCYEIELHHGLIDSVGRRIESPSIGEWNDATERKFEEVKALLDELDI